MVAGGRTGSGYVWSNDGGILDLILAWDDETQEWEEVGKMKMERYNHAITAFKLEREVMDFCG